MPEDVLPTEFYTHPGPSPHEATTELRGRCPVHRIDVPPGARAYAVLGHEEVARGFSDPRLSKQVENLPDPYREKAAHASLLLVGNMIFADPPEHTRLKSPVSRAFRPAAVARLRPRIQEIVDDLIDAFPASGEVDLLSAFALPLPLITICEYLGVPVEDRPLFQRWSFVLSQDPLQYPEGKVKRASSEFRDYFRQLVAKRRADLREDLLSELIRARDSGALSEDELLSSILVLIIAGHKTVANMIGNGTFLLLRHPEQLAMLRERPDLMPCAVEEILRYEGPAAWATLRVAAEEMQLGGTEIPEGSFVHLSLAGAGHDPEAYQDPEHFDITRSPNRHLSFGHGAHFCIGAPLARIEGEIAFTTLLRRLPHFELAVGPEELAWIADSSIGRGLETLPLRLEGRLPR